jgi:hypothetical protein
MQREDTNQQNKERQHIEAETKKDDKQTKTNMVNLDLSSVVQEAPSHLHTKVVSERT